MNRDLWSLTAFVNGMFLLALSALMLIPAIVDIGTDASDSIAFLLSAAASGGIGALLFVAFRTPVIGTLDRRTGFLLTVSSWIVVSSFGSLPFIFSKLHLSFTDAMFETVSGITTTGATVLSGLDNMAPGLLLWRSLLQWVGGVGIIVMAIAMLPMMRVGGMQLFQLESSDVSGKPFSRANQLARAIATVYLALTFACTIALMMTGMNFFDAINHAMATIATGGFSTHDASVGYFDSVGIEVVLTIFMALSALPLIFYASIFFRGRRAVAKDGQIVAFLKILVIAIVVCTCWNISQGMNPLLALRMSAFNVTSVITDTGFATTDFSAWGSFAVGLFFLLFFIGGCAGSTAGAIKIFRWQILLSGAKRHLRTTLSPNRLVVLKHQQHSVDDYTISAVRNFFFVYLATFTLLSLAVMATGLDFLSSASAIAQAMANAGPGLGPVVGPGTNFESVTGTAKWLVIVGMLLGRLELITVYVLLIPEYWRN